MAQCIVIAPVCLCVCLWVYYHDNLKLRALILTKLGLQVKVMTVSSWLNFGRPTPREGVCGEAKFLALPCYTTASTFSHLFDGMMWYSAQHFTCAKNEGTAYSITAANIVSWFLLVDKKWPIFCHTLDFLCDFFYGRISLRIPRNWWWQWLHSSDGNDLTGIKCKFLRISVVTAAISIM